MLKLFAAASIAVFAMSMSAPEPADAQQTQARVKKERKATRYTARSTAQNNNGPCMRDSCKPEDKLDFRNRCDVEEFWNRINDRGSNNSSH